MAARPADRRTFHHAGGTADVRIADDIEPLFAIEISGKTRKGFQPGDAYILGLMTREEGRIFIQAFTECVKPAHRPKLRLRRVEWRVLEPGERTGFDVVLVKPAAGWKPKDLDDVPPTYCRVKIAARYGSEFEAGAFACGYNNAEIKEPAGEWAIVLPRTSKPRKAAGPKSPTPTNRPAARRVAGKK